MMRVVVDKIPIYTSACFSLPKRKMMDTVGVNSTANRVNYTRYLVTNVQI